MVDLFTQSLWTVALWYCAFVNFDAFRFRKMPMRLVGFLGSVIAVVYGIQALDHLEGLLSGLSPERSFGVEVLIPVGLAAWFQYPKDDGVARGRRIRLSPE